MGVRTGMSGSLAEKQPWPSSAASEPLTETYRTTVDAPDASAASAAGVGWDRRQGGGRLRPACVWLTLLAGLALLVLLVPGAEVARTRSRAVDSCSISLVESIPIGLTYNSSVSHMSTFDAWQRLLRLATGSVSIASYYWTLLGRDVVPDPSAAQGEEIYRQLTQTGLRSDVTLKIAQNTPDGKSNDTQHLADIGAAEVRSLDFPRLVGAGILHTKMWLVDARHFYVGSANLDYRSLTQVKELGALVQDCKPLAADMDKIFQVYWLVGGDTGRIPDEWPDQYHTDINKDNPLPVSLPDETAYVYLSSSPPALCPPGRTSDGDAIVHTIDAARKCVHIAVMDYYPMLIYGRFTFWPVIDDALRRAAVDRGVEVLLLASHWNHTHADMYHGLRSLQALNGTRKHIRIEVRMFEVPPSSGQQIPYSRVNHNKYMVTDQVAYIGTSNWSGDYFVNTGGIGLVVNSSSPASAGALRSQLEAVFQRDWQSDHSRPLADFD
ncbi:5'-3' exonuclease PLD3-like [Pollicipes pollicipes]|uniref:5'-3' exonuclease PLD3-like n=1 Tax=Pollicipes pollicipes TaxID=41117 RepID=UPI0018857A0D|nr:5'-3' exonuclease PLD3-like [Pollicipes pollicipes]XP_037073589.1 5'-3' exonuclease PLD3-like [Pollicipes pollicipes]XP_037073590.1 5'-3' exonuclease PLD3-like [Pollicipes pollicipes]XP_037073591.1 5'-3' exonuclease PLD3-like [Pollicipes pollicipes]XP_037073592.1 5'-3' exonuclease PLD3-like [Pollicipes pollicipes]XP_037073593.1 5'-3' exonuclease PLD3-like [Pollicipes pollicipes]XP_037073594.1 5'-3' exonuclease PLD3-like [Pollicipes pollicipes]XP_037073595.1 5'-3' exonuclease PLD3-like [Po